ncbi:MAG: hypothetical protein ACI8RD_004192 [Bacillariaceae sp.]|jgi:hypothetical protein
MREKIKNLGIKEKKKKHRKTLAHHIIRID